jgi:CHASE2 domain-containing sensor protein
VSDAGLATERTTLARRRTTLPFLVLALLGARVALDVPVRGLLLAALSCLGAVVAVRRSPPELTLVVLLVAACALAVPGG